MPQIQLPFFPPGVTHITSELAFKVEEGVVVYFNGSMPVFMHDQGDTRTFRMITSQFCINGNAKLAEIARAFGVPDISVKRAVKLYRAEGPAGFYKKKKGRKKTVLTEIVLSKAQAFLNEGGSVDEISSQLKIKPDTLRKAIQSGRLQSKKKASGEVPRVSEARRTTKRS